ncbi:MAG: hypothetical protein AUJ75_02615 [Candidatus Omnitrophica bacterium CG1_02_49_10]|nr:MAG: hypothetical protein AUJ75_02615 [Candidatus Omnitrophica bacterium CG1_02_49_10]
MGSKKAKEEFGAYSRYFTFFSGAPVVIAVVAKPYDSTTARILKTYDGNVSYSSSAGIQGVAAAIENMLLTAAALGLGACWMTGPLIAKDGLEKVLGIKAPNELAALIPLGYPVKEPIPNEFPESIENITTEL